MKISLLFLIFLFINFSNGVYIDINKTVMNGDETQPHQYPFAVAIRSTLTGVLRRTRQCGGSIISRLAILTSAYCVTNIVDTTVFLGAHTIEDPNERFQIKITLPVSSVIRHPGYVNNQFANDIAIIKLPTPIGFFNHAINLAYLPTSPSNAFINEPAITMGFGADSWFATPLNRLVSTNVDTIDNAACSPGFTLQSSQICTNGLAGVCDGDDGGPLVIARGGEYLQIGIIQVASDGSALAACRLSTLVYTRVTSFLDWIEANM